MLTGRTVDLFREVDGVTICNACNVRPEWPGEHRCFRTVDGVTCECSTPLCRLDRGEVTLEQLMAEDENKAKDTT